MADNLAVTAGSGSTIGMDEVADATLGTVKVGFGKIMDGTLDSTNKLIVNSSGEALVKPTANSQVDVNKIAGTTTDTNSGNKSAGTQRVVLATDQPQLTNALKVDGSAVTQPVSGTVTATTGLTTADLDTGAGTDTRAVVGLVGSKSGGGVLIPGDATKGLAVDLTATGANATALKVDGSAVTQPVSGTVTATGPLTDTQLRATAVPVSGTFFQSTQPVSEADGTNVTLGAKADAKSVATDTTAVSAMSVLKQISASVQAPPSQAVTNAGTFAVQATLAAETTKVIGAVNNLPATVDVNSGNKSASTLRVVLATDQPALTNKLLVTPDSVALPANQSVNQAQVAGNATSVGVGASGTGTQRIVQANDAGKTILSAGGSASTSGNNTLVAAGTNKLKVKAFMLSTTSTTAMTCIFQSGASGTELWRVILQAPTGTSVGATQSVPAPDWLFATGTATLLNLNLSSANAVHWAVTYYDEA